MANNLARFWRLIKGMADAANRRKRTEITIETDQVLIIRHRRSVRSWCQKCGREVDMVGLKEAEALTGMTQPLLVDGQAEQAWHWSQAEDGSPLVCLESLLKPNSGFFPKNQQ